MENQQSESDWSQAADANCHHATMASENNTVASWVASAVVGPGPPHSLSPEGSNDLRDKASSNQGVSFCCQMNPISLIEVRS
jgi:hypothetical protein